MPENKEKHPMLELTIKVKARGNENIMGIKENIALALDDVPGVLAVQVIEVIDVQDIGN